MLQKKQFPPEKTHASYLYPTNYKIQKMQFDSILPIEIRGNINNHDNIDEFNIVEEMKDITVSSSDIEEFNEPENQGENIIIKNIKEVMNCIKNNNTIEHIHFPFKKEYSDFLDSIKKRDQYSIELLNILEKIKIDDHVFTANEPQLKLKNNYRCPFTNLEISITKFIIIFVKNNTMTIFTVSDGNILIIIESLFNIFNFEKYVKKFITSKERILSDQKSILTLKEIYENFYSVFNEFKNKF